MTTLTFKRVRAPFEADEDAIKVELFRNDEGRVCGWFLGPVRLAKTGVSIPYLPRSQAVVASVAVIRAVEAANAAGLQTCIVDPDDLWDHVWQA